MSWRDWVPPILSRKASATTRALALLVTPGQPVWTPKNYEALSKASYEANVTVYVCVNAIAKAIAGLSWLLQRRRRGQWEELDAHPLLALLQRPNPWQGKGKFFETWTGYLMLSGNAYIERVAPGAAEGQRARPPVELYTLRPDRMAVLPEAVERIGGYRYKAGSQEVRFPAAQILHTKLFSPTDDWYGLTPIGVAGKIVDLDNAAVTWNYALLKNGARPSGALVASGTLPDPQFMRLQAQIETEYRGAERAGTPLLLEGGLDWKEMGITPKDLDFIEGRKMSKADIAMLYGVPGELIGLKEATFENRKEARKAFYSETVLPLADMLRDELSNWLVPVYGEELRLDYDRDTIEALQEDRAKLWDRIRQADWLQVNEKRAATGYAPDPAGDVILVPATSLPLGTDVGATFDALPAQAGAAGPDETKTEAARARLWKGLIRPLLAIERELGRAVARYFRAQEERVLARLPELLAAARGTRSGAGPAEAKAVEELLFALDEETGRLRQVTRAYFERALAQGGTAVWTSVGASGAFGADAPAAQARISRQLEAVRSIPETARRRVARAIEAGLNAEGGAESVAQIAERIRDVYGALTRAQAQTIARTETAKAYNEGRDVAMAELGVEETEWLSARDEWVRTTPFNHAIDGEVRRRGERFSNGLRYPCEPEGAPGNVINCRCVALPVVRRA